VTGVIAGGTVQTGASVGGCVPSKAPPSTPLPSPVFVSWHLAGHGEIVRLIRTGRWRQGRQAAKTARGLAV
jgi:hypothetical protein